MDNIEVYVNKRELANTDKNGVIEPIYHNPRESLEILVKEGKTISNTLKRTDLITFSGCVSASFVVSILPMVFPYSGILAGLTFAGIPASLISAIALGTALSENTNTCNDKKFNSGYYTKLKSGERIISWYKPVFHKSHRVIPISDYRSLSTVCDHIDDWENMLYFFNNVELKQDENHNGVELTKWTDQATLVTHWEMDMNYVAKCKDLLLNVRFKTSTTKDPKEVPILGSNPIYIIGKLDIDNHQDKYTLTPVEWGPATYKVAGLDFL